MASDSLFSKLRPYLAGLVVVVLLFIVVLIVYRVFSGFWFWPYLAGLVVVILFLSALAIIVRGNEGDNIWQLVIGADGRASSSKFQILIWTCVILFAYVAVFSADPTKSISGIPGNVLTALGLSIVTATAAKGITTSLVESGSVIKQKNPGAAKLREFFEDDNGKLDLGKSQMLAWTGIAVLVYIYRLYAAIKTGSFVVDGSATLPDIDSTLMVLMGLGQGAYLGTKLTTTNTPKITGLSVGAGKKGDKLTIFGSSFTDSKEGNLITFDGKPLQVNPAETEWKDAQISLTIPDSGVSATTPEGLRVEIGVVVGGHESLNKLPFTLLP
jgi:hypothetical protein